MTGISDEVLTNAGERMVVGNSWGYYAHLSIYHFALRFAAGKVLDAGSGAGYGSAYLARHGAKVLALDAGARAIEHSRLRYAGDSVTFEVADLNAPLALGDGVFDMVFSSNVFEHVGNVDGLAAECARVMAADGVAVIAVPPVCSAAIAAADMENQFHVHHIPPPAWQAKLSRFFSDVRCHAHVGAGVFADKDRERAEITMPAANVTIRETDFDFPSVTPEAMLAANDSITAVFVCRGRRWPAGPETLDERAPASWCEGKIAANLIGRLRGELAQARAAIRPASIPAETVGSDAAARHVALLEAQKRELKARVAALEASTTWRATAPVRRMIDAVRR